MLAMAEQTLPVISVHSSNVYVAPAIPTLHDIKLPPREVGENGLASKLEAALGFVGLVAVALLALLVVSRQRELIRLRAEVGQAMQLEAQQRPLLANVGASRPEPQAEGPPAG
jgi:hypothetical protein